MWPFTKKQKSPYLPHTLFPSGTAAQPGLGPSPLSAPLSAPSPSPLFTSTTSGNNDSDFMTGLIVGAVVDNGSPTCVDTSDSNTGDSCCDSSFSDSGCSSSGDSGS